jgi:hypothetical protein
LFISICVLVLINNTMCPYDVLCPYNAIYSYDVLSFSLSLFGGLIV